MNDKIKRVIFGYNTKQVMACIERLRDDYEGELTKKQDRMTELLEENRMLKGQLKELEDKLLNYEEQEGYISRALVMAEKKAQDIIENSQKKAREERYKLELEKAKWKERVREIRRQMLDFERTVCETLEEFRAEVNYLTSKEISEALLCDEDILLDEENDKNIRSVS